MLWHNNPTPSRLGKIREPGRPNLKPVGFGKLQAKSGKP